MDTIVACLNFTVEYLDVLIKCDAKREHSEHLQVFKRIEDYGLKSSEEKKQIFRSNVKYLGQIIDVN